MLSIDSVEAKGRPSCLLFLCTIRDDLFYIYIRLPGMGRNPLSC